MPVEAQEKNICPSEERFISLALCPIVKREEGEIDGDHEFEGILEFPFNFACAMCESGTYETPYPSKCFRCMHCVGGPLPNT